MKYYIMGGQWALDSESTRQYKRGDGGVERGEIVVNLKRIVSHQHDFYNIQDGLLTFEFGLV
jgi:hypothetical protein